MTELLCPENILFASTLSTAMSSSERGNFHRVLFRVFTRECVVWFYIPVLPDFLQCFIHSEFHDTLIRLHNWDFFFFVLNKSAGEGKAKIRNYKYFLPLAHRQW